MIRTVLTILLLAASFAGHAASDADSRFEELYAKSAESGQAQTPYALLHLEQGLASSGNFSFKSIGRLANYLADDFSLYSKVHGEAIRDKCMSEGADIDPYLAELAEQGTPDRTVAQAIYARLGVDYEMVWQELKPQALRETAAITARFATVLNVPVDGFCTHLVNDPDGSARRLAYASIRASRSQVLRAISP